MATLSDIARAAGVSSAVVSRVINKDPSLRISKATREKVVQAIEDLDYSPNIAAQSLRLSKSGLIGILLHDVTNPVYAEIMRGAQGSAVRHGKALLVFDSAMGEQSASRLAAMMGGGALDGLIIQAAGEVSESVLAKAAGRKIPTIFLQTGLDIEGHLISLPDEEAATIAAAHLIDWGHRRIGCLATAASMRFTKMRLAGWRKALAGAGLEAPENAVVYAGPEMAAGELGCAKLIARYPEITAMVCFNVLSAIGALKHLNEIGRRVPEDISIVAIHDIPFADVLSTPITTVSMPLYQMGWSAVDIVCGSLVSASESVVTAPSPRLISRHSVSRLS